MEIPVGCYTVFQMKVLPIGSNIFEPRQLREFYSVKW
jgi:hypothetical protein